MVQSSRLSATYHVLVVGGDLGGLMYAALAARAGYRVGVLGHGSRPNVYRHQGHMFLRRAEHLYGFSTSPVVARVFSDLNLGMEMKNRPRSGDPILQMVLPDRRLDLPRSAERWRRELARELSDEGEGMLDFEGWASRWTEASNAALLSDVTLPASGLGASQRYRRAYGHLDPLLNGRGRQGIDPLLGAYDGGVSRGIVQAAVAHLSSVIDRPLSPLATARLWTHLRAGLHRVPGGLDGLSDLFVAKLKEQCGDHRPDAVVQRVVMKRGRVTEVVLADRGERLGCSLLVANTDPRRFVHLIPADGRQDRLHADLLAQEPTGWRMTVNVAVDPQVIPAGMGADVLRIADLRAPLEGANSLWISRPGVAPFAQGDGGLGPGLLTVSTVLPARGIAPGPPLVKRALAQAMEGLRSVVPWLDDYLLAVHAPALVTDPRTGHEDVDVSALEPIMGHALDMSAGVSAAGIETPYKNVLLSGGSLLGGLGFEGACLGALQVLDTTKRLLRLKVLRPGLG